MRIRLPAYFLALVLLVLCCGPARSETVTLRPDFQRYFDAKHVTGCIAVFDLQRDAWTRCNPDRCAEPFLPASTFKIVNTLLALQTGVVSGRDFPLPWDGVDRGLPAWNRDQTLETAFRQSVVWYYVELAGRMGKDRIKACLDQIGYGNADVSGGDRFWLDGDLRISADGQVRFLQKLWLGQLPIDPAHMALVKDLMVLERSNGATLYGKTGMTRQDGRDLGWLVGFVEKGGQAWAYALNIETSAPGPDFGQTRLAIVKEVLGELGVY